MPKKKQPQRIKAGTTVTWGRRTGAVVAFVPAWKDAPKYAPEAFPDDTRPTVRTWTTTNRYIVRVESVSAVRGVRRVTYSSVSAGVLERANPDAPRED